MRLSLHEMVLWYHQHMDRIYLDNAATSFPKAPGTAEVVYDYLKHDAVNLYRTESMKSEGVFSEIYSLREGIASLFRYPHPECIAFTSNATEALNLAIKGLIRRGSKVMISRNEHNAVMRPLSQLSAVTVTDDEDGISAVIVNAADNISGQIEDLGPYADAARKHSVPLIIDASQASPYADISMEDLDAAAICFPGHKGFLGPEGTGGVILRRDIAETIEPLVAGGTGTESDNIGIPSTLPERLTGGTENIPGLIGLSHSLSYTLSNLGSIRRNTRKITEYIHEKLSSISGIRIIASDDLAIPIISITADKDIAWLSSVLLERGRIETRVGLHCSPETHRRLGTFPGGTLRFSPGPFTTEDEIDITAEILKEAMDE